MLSVSRNVCPCVCLSVCLFVHLWGNILKYFCPPLSKVGCPKFLEIRNLRGKVILRSGLRFENFFLIQGVKSQRKKKLVFGQIMPYRAGFFWYLCFSLILTVFLHPLPNVQCENFLDFRNTVGKVLDSSGLRFENFC